MTHLVTVLSGPSGDGERRSLARDPRGDPERRGPPFLVPPPRLNGTHLGSGALLRRRG
ncbi:hypothetical protein OHA77_40905 [Streptosporangium sp. NBC_01639]|uniref:hypothetical protein n=1 Tax=Streptosporangium sp. NBC_01639 TaxID=2975948 RepID=UPI0038655D94|nr:hypothetical protein OHA77_40905 [Streptosporangium sp. NBC_01639]